MTDKLLTRAALKILFVDTETSLMTVRTFSMFAEITNHDMIIKDWHIICACWKWQGDRKVHNASTLEGERELLVKLREALINADLVVGHNLDSFDIKKINARLIYHELPPIPKLNTFDTLKAIRKVAKISSNRLDYLAKYLGLDGKTKTPSNLWPMATDGDEKAIRAMVKYCANDVRVLEDVYHALLPYFTSHPNLNTLRESEVPICPLCESEHLQPRGFSITNTGKYQRYQCLTCNKWSRGKKNLNTKVELR